MKKSKILITSVSLKRRGGVTNYVKTLYKSNYINDIEFKHFTQSRKSKSNPFSDILFLFINLLRFFLVLKKFDPHLVHLNPSIQRNSLIRDFVYSIISKVLGYKTMFFIHGWNERIFNFLTSHEFLNELFIFLLRTQDKIVVLDYSFKEKLVSVGVAEQKIYVSSTMVEVNKYQRKQPILSDNNINILFCSRIEKEKGIFILLNSLKYLPDEILKRIKLIYLGKGSDLEELRNNVKDSEFKDQIEIKGFVSEKEKFRIFKESDLFVFPTYYGEGFPTVVLEAMAAGLPVITTDVGGSKRAIRNGENGILIRNVPPTPEELASKIEEILYFEYEEISERNLRSVKSNYSIKSVVKSLEKVYKQVISKI